ncbi:MAG: hypothetical protein ACI89U_000808 [Gammaproteobacteria bacterium]|jgi:hypothetical protein
MPIKFVADSMDLLLLNRLDIMVCVLRINQYSVRRVFIDGGHAVGRKLS